MIKKGSTRFCVLIGNYCFKFPIFWKGTKIFLKGWLGNIDERDIWIKIKDKKLCPTIFSFLGIFNIMKRAKPFRPQIFNYHTSKWLKNYFKTLPIIIDMCSREKNFGYLNDQIVLIDYASMRESTEFCEECYGGCE
jgi:hypothetical protein